MRRRSLLAALAGTTTLAGCLGDASPTTETPTPELTPTPDTTPTPDPTVADDPATPTDVAFEVLDRRCGVGRSAASIGFAGEMVTVEGTIGGRDTCDTARLAEASYRAGVLAVVVEVFEEPHTEEVACAQCLTDIEYEASASVPVDAPLTVRVVHHDADGESTVATADRS